MTKNVLKMSEQEKKQILEQHNTFRSLLKEDSLSQKKMQIMKAWDSYPVEDKKKFKAAMKKCRKKLGLTKLKIMGGITLGLLVFAASGPAGLAIGELLGFLGFLGGLTKVHIDQTKRLAACVEEEMKSPDLETTSIINVDTPDDDDDESTESSEIEEEAPLDFP